MSATDLDVPAAIAGLTRWMLDEARFLAEPTDFGDQLCDRLRDAGVPLDRAALIAFLLHPLFDGVTVRWRRGHGTEREIHRHGEQDQPSYRASPVAALRERRIDRLRARLADDDAAAGAYPLLGQLRADGFTDYLLLPMRFSDRTVHALSFATREPGGFGAAQIALLEGITALITVLTEVHVSRLVAEKLLGTYLGEDAGRRVLGGQVRRGDGESIQAVVLISDLRGFTGASDHHDRGALLDLLDDYFEVIVAAIDGHGGQVLKFIGDAVLAIFPIAAGTDDAAAACARAAEAARAALAGVERANQARAAAGKLPIDCGLALHLGEVMYGNIGAPSRLDFTVIGPAVNMVSRIEGLCRDLDRPLLVSAAFAAAHGGALEDLGEHHLRGIDVPVRVFALTP